MHINVVHCSPSPSCTMRKEWLLHSIGIVPWNSKYFNGLCGSSYICRTRKYVSACRHGCKLRSLYCAEPVMRFAAGTRPMEQYSVEIDEGIFLSEEILKAYEI